MGLALRLARDSHGIRAGIAWDSNGTRAGLTVLFDAAAAVCYLSSVLVCCAVGLS